MNKVYRNLKPLNHHQIRYLIQKRLNKAFELMGDNYDWVLILNPIKGYIPPSKRKNK